MISMEEAIDILREKIPGIIIYSGFQFRDKYMFQTSRSKWGMFVSQDGAISSEDVNLIFDNLDEYFEACKKEILIDPPEKISDAEAKRLEFEEMNEKAENAVKIAVEDATATGAIQIPFADIPILVTEQVDLMTTLCEIYKINISQDGLKMLAVTAIGTGSAISGSTASVITLAMGKTFIEVCKMVKTRKFSEKDLTDEKGKAVLRKRFRKLLKEHKEGNPMMSLKED